MIGKRNWDLEIWRLRVEWSFVLIQVALGVCKMKLQAMCLYPTLHHLRNRWASPGLMTNENHTWSFGNNNGGSSNKMAAFVAFQNWSAWWRAENGSFLDRKFLSWLPRYFSVFSSFKGLLSQNSSLLLRLVRCVWLPELTYPFGCWLPIWNVTQHLIFMSVLMLSRAKYLNNSWTGSSWFDSWFPEDESWDFCDPVTFLWAPPCGGHF